MSIVFNNFRFVFHMFYCREIAIIFNFIESYCYINGESEKERERERAREEGRDLHSEKYFAIKKN